VPTLDQGSDHAHGGCRGRQSIDGRNRLAQELADLVIDSNMILSREVAEQPVAVLETPSDTAPGDGRAAAETRA
jgi:hypothetical protein